MKTVLQGARDMERAAAALAGPIPASAVSASAQVVKNAAKREMDKIAPSGRFSHVGKSGAKVGVSYTVKPGVHSTALVRATGPWQLVENDTKAHPEISHSVGRAKGRTKAARHEAKQSFYNAIFGVGGAFSGAKPLRTPYGPRFRVNIPIVRGRHPWAHGVAKAIPQVRKTMQQATVEPLRAIFK